MLTYSRRLFLASIPASLYSQVIGSKAPNFWARDLDGEKYTTENIKGKVTLIQFWTTWCPYCRADHPAVEKIVTEFKDKGLTVLGINVGESKKKVNKFLETTPRSCKIVLMEDTNLAAMFAAKAYPVYVLIDRDGNLVARQNGAAGEEALRRLLAKAGLESE